MAFNFRPKIVKDSLVLYLDAANTNSYVSGDTTWNSMLKGPDVSSTVNSSAFSNDGVNHFNGTSATQRFEIAHADLDYNRTGFTIETWVRYESTYSSWLGSIFSKWQTGANSNNEFWWVSANVGAEDTGPGVQIINFQNPAGGNSGDIAANTTMEVGSWYQCSFTFNLGDVIFYINGAYDGSGTTGFNTVKTYASQPFTPIGFGSGPFGAGYFASEANIAKVAMYNKVLTPEEISQNYKALKGRFGL